MLAICFCNCFKAKIAHYFCYFFVNCCYVLATPGHTHEHLSYYCKNQRLLLPGDTLFAGGCGRSCIQRYDLLYDSLVLLATLPDDTLVFPAHEYTQDNLTFALTIEPNNTLLQNYISHVNNLRCHGLVTLPCLLGQEKRINPFLRCHLEIIAAAVNLRPTATAAEVFTQLRQMKDQFHA